MRTSSNNQNTFICNNLRGAQPRAELLEDRIAPAVQPTTLGLFTIPRPAPVRFPPRVPFLRHTGLITMPYVLMTTFLFLVITVVSAATPAETA